MCVYVRVAKDRRIFSVYLPHAPPERSVCASICKRAWPEGVQMAVSRTPPRFWGPGLCVSGALHAFDAGFPAEAGLREAPGGLVEAVPGEGLVSP